MMDTSPDWIFPKEFIDNPRSDNCDGSKTLKEKDNRSRTIWFMEDLCKRMNVERRVLSSACVYFHRFYLFHSFEQQNRFHVALASLFLAGKVEERAIKLKSLVEKYFQLRYPQKKATEAEFNDMRKSVILAERLLLQALNFDLNIVQPYSFLSIRMREIRPYVAEAYRPSLFQTAVNFLNDSFRSTFCLQYTAAQIAAAALYLASVSLSIKPMNPNPRSSQEILWSELLERDVDERTLYDICLELMAMYDQMAFIIPLKMKEDAIQERQRITAQLMLTQGRGGREELLSSKDLDPMAMASIADSEVTHEEQSYGEEVDEVDGSGVGGSEQGSRPKQVTVTVFKQVTEQQQQHYFQSHLKHVSSSSAAADETPQLGNDSIVSTATGVEETPYITTQQQGQGDSTPELTPRFSDLQKIRYGKERSNSLCSDASAGKESKRLRTE